MVSLRPRSARSALLALVAASAAVSLLSSCQYGLAELFVRDDPVGARSLESSARDSTIDAQKVRLAAALPAGTAFSFIVASDLHFDGSLPDATTLESFASLAKDSGADFAIFAGDLADKGRESEYRLFSAFADSLKSGAASHLGEGASLPWFAAVGNHDLYNSGWSYFAKYAGRSTERFSAGSTRFFLVDSGSGTLGERQIEELGSAMGADASPKIVISHYPVRGSPSYSYFKLTNTRERAALLSLFNEDSVKLLICGHWHSPESSDCGFFKERLPGSLTPSKDGLCRAAIVKIGADGSVLAFEVHTL
jgi:Predicted phosphohydrolases